MSLGTLVWPLIQTLKIDEFIATHTRTKSLLRKAIPRSRAYRRERYEHRINSELSVVLDRSDYTQWRMFSGDLSINRNIFRHFNVDINNFTMIDIGANIGGFTILMSKEITSSNFNVHLFEPNPDLVPVLEENINRLRSSNAAVKPVINKVAVGDKRTTLPLQICSSHSGLATLAPADNSYDTSIDVDVIVLDDYLDGTNIDRIDLIKIDVESYEPSVLRGALNTLQRFRPVLYLEYSSEWFQHFDIGFLQSLFKDLNELNYSFYREGRDGSLNSFSLTEASLREYSHLNILAVKP